MCYKGQKRQSDGGADLAKNSKKVRINRKKGGGPRPLVSLLIVIILIIVAFFLLEKLKKPVPEKHVTEPTPAVHKKTPVTSGKPPVETVKPPVVHKRYSTTAKLPPREPRERLPVSPPQILEPVGRGTVAIIIDDMGSSLWEVESLMAIDVPMTFSIIPGLAKSRQVALAARSRAYEVMIHMPMEPQDYPNRRLEKNGLLMSESNEEIRNQVNEYLREVPDADGANNHMGSRFTEDAEKMEAALKPLRERGFYFVDSMTTPRSVGRKTARELGMKTASRDVFLDNTQDVSAIRKQIQALARLAAKRGSAIGICHPHKTTIEALAAELPVLRNQGINFVHVSDLVR
jgi:polysaccharide deacetylase 2 family uncharacterized protein YibQ